ncbi:MAG: class II fructose-bisphosphate aldolase [Hydrogenovibrio sp.]|uniref:class II fructose-bisphosphate aldolase n=1 Tax=Hydrogenovibrio TaxID=28884 RepID=UPI00036C107E|nr:MULTISPECIES: class II fructose-bisphosphate aldolase [Hydrogenovibrio]MDR9498420.1 class II fructose-bisphosphate aldolase [Hydrogenovibrio sp.]
MAMITLRELMDYAAEHGFGMPAFNVNNMEQVRAIMDAAKAVDSPVILQGSAGARKYAGEPFLRHLIEAATEMYPEIPVVMHQDHGSDPGVCTRAIQSGFTSVMMDGSLEADMKTPASYEYNVDVTRTVVDIAHSAGVSVEGELGCLGSLETGMMGEEDGHGSDEKMDMDALLTDPEEAADFVKKTNLDALAVAVGTSHGAYKFTSKPSDDVLRIDRIKEIHERIPDTHIVMHGSSSVPEEWLEIINNYGGDMGQTFGVPVDAIVEGIKHGVRKVNIDTDLRMASTGAVRKHLAENPSNFDPRKFLKSAQEAMSDICKHRFEAFGCAGHASKIKSLGLEEMQRRYAAGDLDQRVK